VVEEALVEVVVEAVVDLEAVAAASLTAVVVVVEAFLAVAAAEEDSVVEIGVAEVLAVVVSEHARNLII